MSIIKVGVGALVLLQRAGGGWAGVSGAADASAFLLYLYPLSAISPMPKPHPTHARPQVDGDGQYTRISGSSVGGGTFWGLCSLLTGKRDFDEILALSATGNNANVSGRARVVVSGVVVSRRSLGGLSGRLRLRLRAGVVRSCGCIAHEVQQALMKRMHPPSPHPQNT